jgi:hypothetical protein
LLGIFLFLGFLSACLLFGFLFGVLFLLHGLSSRLDFFVAGSGHIRLGNGLFDLFSAGFEREKCFFVTLTDTNWRYGVGKFEIVSEIGLFHLTYL